MKKRMLVFLTISFVLVLSSCKEEKDYEPTDHYLGDLQVYQVVEGDFGCEDFDTETIIEFEDSEYRRVICSNIEHYVYVDGEYIEFFEYINSGGIDIYSVIASRMVQEYSLIPLSEELDIDMDNLSLVRIDVYTVDGEIHTEGLSPDWEMKTVDLSYEDIQTDIEGLLGHEVGFSNVCDSHMCVLLGPSPEVHIYLTDGVQTIKLSIDNGEAMYIELESSIDERDFYYVSVFYGYEDFVSGLYNDITSAYNNAN